MRILGIDPAKAPESLRPIFERSLKLFGRIITPNLVMARRPEILMAAAKLGLAIGAEGVVDARLKLLASVRAAQLVGCPF